MSQAFHAKAIQFFFNIGPKSPQKYALKYFFLNIVFIKFTEIVVDLERL